MKNEMTEQILNDFNLRPDDFKIGAFNLWDKKTGSCFWIANGAFSFKMEKPFEFHFGYWNSRKIMRGIEDLKAKKYLALAKGTERKDET